MQAWPALRSSTEQRFMEASLAYSAKKSILSDAEFDELKRKLRKQYSKVVQQARAPARGHPAARLPVLERILNTRMTRWFKRHARGASASVQAGGWLASSCV
jgi:hypothetical protein